MTEPIEEHLARLKSEAAAALKEAATAQELETWRIQYLGRQGAIPRLLRTIKDLPLELRRTIGQQGNTLRQELEQAYAAKKKTMPAGLPAEASAKAGKTPGVKEAGVGHLHPLTIATRDIQAIFSELGFLLAEGPLIEDPKYNFDLLNIPLEHPARAETDTFNLTNGMVLRTHTSPVQLRSVLTNNLTPPFSVYSPGRTFRAERTDASHEHTFSQVEALMVGNAITIADFKGTVEYLYSKFFNQDITTRLRPSYFPFVEPGFEIDMSCVICRQQGCSVCQRSGWLEMMGAGMVHPNVLRNMNVDHKKFQGFAFGGGIERLAMLRHGISDIRLFLSGDLRFLRQFS